MKNTAALCLPVLVVLALSGCATPPPVAEVRMVAKAFDNLNAASQPLLDDLALAERAQGKSAAEARARQRSGDKPASGNATMDHLLQRCPGILMLGGEGNEPGVQSSFCIDDSYYYSELADPPGTRAFRQALAAVGDYTQLLLVLAEGRNIDEAKGQLQVLAGNVGMALEAAGGGGAGMALGEALNALDPLIALAAKDATAEDLRRVVSQESPKVMELVTALRSAASELFRTVTEAPLARFNTEGLTNLEVARVEAQRIESYRAGVSSYVVLLDQYSLLLGDLVMVYDKPRAPATVASLAERSAQLSAQADAWRRALAAMRTGLR